MGPKKKNRHLDDWEKDFEALDDNGDLKEPEVAVKPAGKSKKKAQKKGKKAAAFASDDDEDVPAPALAKSPEPSEKAHSENEEEEVSEEDVPAVKPKGGRKKAPAFSFALLGGDDDEEEEEEEEEGEEEEEEEPPRQPVAAKVVSIKAHPKADKLRIVKLAAGPLLGDLQVVTNAPQPGQAPGRGPGAPRQHHARLRRGHRRDQVARCGELRHDLLRV
ncbi:hypothetical protein QBZ16_000936 [Prototheca wickerhamii]|uniref:Uncharacterized protein n=1 Tax=Prototheca wickerhamii TaxID=3111 RepID=A0AAD9MM58_PROWI|nr:hypothetical protein QBZ16_000936 [Prototheca wickerhamii]